MTTAAFERGSLGSRAWAALVAGWGAFIGLLPHVLHHVGPPAGAALLAGAGGTALFSLSSFVIAPLISGEDDPAQPGPGFEQPAGHEQHH